MTGPEGEVLDLESDGVEYLSRNQVQLLTLSDPDSGEWSINLSNEDRDEAAVFSLLISTKDCLGAEGKTEPDKLPDSSIPFLLTNRGLTVLTGGVVAAIVIFGGAVTLLIRFRQRRNE